MKFKRSTAALCYALLNGKKVSILTGFNDFGITNIPREMGRSIERKFGVSVERTWIEGKSRYGIPVNYIEYKLPRSPENKEGINNMYAFVEENMILPEQKNNGFTTVSIF